MLTVSRYVLIVAISRSQNTVSSVLSSSILLQGYFQSGVLDLGGILLFFSCACCCIIATIAVQSFHLATSWEMCLQLKKEALDLMFASALTIVQLAWRW